MLCLCLCSSHFLLKRSDEKFAADSGPVHSGHYLTRCDVAFHAGGTQMEYKRWGQPDRVEVRFKGHKGDQEQMGSVRVRTRIKVCRSKSSFRKANGVVTLLLELMSAFLAFPTTPPSSRTVLVST